jgi:hypothetical protein
MATHAKHKKAFVPKIDTPEKATGTAYDLDLISDEAEPVWADNSQKEPEPPQMSYIDQFIACKKALVEAEAKLSNAEAKLLELEAANSQLGMHLKAALAEQGRMKRAEPVLVRSRSV